MENIITSIKKNKTRLSVHLTLIATVLTCFTLSCDKEMASPPKIYKKLSRITNEIKIDIKPTQIGNKNPIIFNVSFESYQNKDFIENNPKDITLLEDSFGNPYTPIEWKEESATDYTKKGQLIFQPTSQPSKSLTLYVFEPQKEAFNWILDSAEKETVIQ